jgi:uncharacterized OB-fold protein
MSEGWKCPGCGRCYSPCVTECSRCGQPGLTDTGGTVIITDRCQCPFPFYIYETSGARCGNCGKPIRDPWGWSLTDGNAGTTPT